MPETVKVREILLYSEKVAVADVKNFFNHILKSRIPLFGFIDFSDILSFNVVRLIIKKNMNTIRFFAREKKALGDLSLLVFPYKISEPMEIEKSKGSMFPFPKLYFLPGAQNFLDFSVRENLSEINLKIIKVLGKFLGFGTAVDEHGKKSLIISTTPEKFMEVDMEQNPAVFIDILDPIPKRMSVTSQYPVFEETGISVGVDNFDVFQHTLLVGASGTGKSKALYAMVKAIEAKYGKGVKMVLIDPHGEFIRCFSEYKVVNLIDNYIEPLDVGGVKTPLMTQLIAQLLASAIGQENKYSERVLFYATHLLSSINKMDLKNISLLLTDSSKRAEFISETENDEVKRFFDEEFNDIYIHHFNDAVLPILNFVGEYELYLGGEKKRENLVDLIANNNITVVSFNPNFFGKRMINFLAGAVINQMYILAITERLKMPTILICDEFQRVETKVARDILAETRKFNLYLYLSMQYLGQISKEVHDSVISNIRNIVSFKANRQDATMLSSIMEIKIEESFKKARSQTELEESKKEMFVRLHQKECIVRLFDGKKYILPMKLHVVDVYSKWGYKEVPLEQVMPHVPDVLARKKQPPEEEAPAEEQEQEAGPAPEAGEQQEEEAQPEPEQSEEEEAPKRKGASSVRSQISAAKGSKRKEKEEPEEKENEWMSLKPDREMKSSGLAGDIDEEKLPEEEEKEIGREEEAPAESEEETGEEPSEEELSPSERRRKKGEEEELSPEEREQSSIYKEEEKPEGEEPVKLSPEEDADAEEIRKKEQEFLLEEEQPSEEETPEPPPAARKPPAIPKAAAKKKPAPAHAAAKKAHAHAPERKTPSPAHHLAKKKPAGKKKK